MDKVYKFIIQKTVTDKIEKKDAVQLLELLKQEKEKANQMDIAIIGVSAKTSLAQNRQEFWQNLKNGVDCIRQIPKDRKKDLDDFLSFRNALNSQIKYQEIAYLEDIDKFDYNFFRLSPREADLMDPNQRIFLQDTFKAIEEAGYGGDRLRGTKTGLYLGFIYPDLSYQRFVYDVDQHLGATTFLANMASLIPSRISFTLDLKGPSMLIDTACSSSLVAVHLACQAIKNGECDQAIAGGIRISLLSLESKLKLGIESSDNRTHAFDESSDGTGQGEGVATVILKPLKKALEDGDIIHSIIKGSAVNQDGQSIGITAPNATAQTDVILSAWKNSQVKPETISYIEAHGTGTELGDPIELEGITQAFQTFTDKKQFCAIGSVKSNIGHLNEAAGIFGLVKAVLCLENKQIPPSLHFHEPNHKVDWEWSPVYVNNKLIQWEKPGDTPRRCGVSSFGLSGTNCHIVLEEAPLQKSRIAKEKKELEFKILTISAKNKNSFNELILAYIKYFSQNRKVNLDDICYTANTGRGHYNFRLAIIFKDKKELVSKLEELAKVNYRKKVLNNVYYNNFEIVSLGQDKKHDKEITEAEVREKTLLASREIAQPANQKKNNQDFLKKICEYYVAGAQIEWVSLYESKKYQKVCLPTYSFEPTRCWMKVPERTMPKNIFFATRWRRRSVVNSVTMKKTETVLVFGKNRLKTADIIKELHKDGKKIIQVAIEKKYQKIDNNKYVIGSDSEDYEKLIFDLKGRNITKVVHLATLDNREEVVSIDDLAKSQVTGVLSLFSFAKAIQKNNIFGSFDLILVSEYVHQVTGQEKKISPENASMIGLGKSISIENSVCSCRTIDIDDETNAETVVKEINSSNSIFKVAYRDNERYEEELDEVSLDEKEEKFINIKKGGVYLITGGTGGIGLEIARHISACEKTKLVLIHRTSLPSKKEWEKIINSKDPKQIELANKLQKILEIEKIGSEVLIINIDISQSEQVKSAIREVKKKFKKIDGIIHAAGLAREELIIDKTEETFKNILAPKVQGTWLLNHYTQDQKLDFFVLFSSAITIISGVAVSDYVAANSYLDAFPFFASKEKRKIITINWPFWEKTGLSLSNEINQRKQLFKTISAYQAIPILFDLISKNLHRIIVGELNYEGDALRLEKFLPFELSNRIKAKINSRVITPEQIPSTRNEPELKGRKDKKYSVIEKELAQIWCDVLGHTEVDVNDNFFDLGGDSILIAEAHSWLEKKYPGKVSVAQLFAYPTISKLAGYLNDGTQLSNLQMDLTAPVLQNKNQDIAIIGIAAKTSEADDVNEFWQNLIQKRESIRDIPRSRKTDVDNYLRFAGAKEEDIKYIRQGYLEKLDGFDYDFFRLSPREAALMDPNQRLFLQTSIEVLESAGYGGDKLRGTKTGLYLGFAPSNFDYQNFISGIKLPSSATAFTGNLNSIIASRIAYWLDLRGPSMLIDTACSSSLVAIHLACQAIRSGDCEQVIAGGMNIDLLPVVSGFKVGIESSDGRTKAFDHKGDGTGLGEGVAAILLKPLEKAIQDGDNIQAVIKGSAINQDGQSVGITAPNASAQTDVILSAWKDARVNPETISYIEAHGTGTELGDPIEIEGITKAFKKYTRKKQFCAIGSVKPNLGHLLEAAGIFSLIKAVLSLQNKKIPATINFHEPNHRADWAESAVYINDKLSEWKNNNSTPRRCGISSFGLAGTNCHVVLEEAPGQEDPNSEKEKRALNIFVLSAKSKKSLRQTTEGYLEFLKKSNSEISNICYTASTGRGHYNYRLAVAVSSKKELKDKLDKFIKSGLKSQKEKGVSFNNFKIILSDKKKTNKKDITKKEMKILGREAAQEFSNIKKTGSVNESFVKKICDLYVRGADINWDDFYQGQVLQKVNLPVYKFDEKRCWVDVSKNLGMFFEKDNFEFPHPLLERCLSRSANQDVYSTIFSPKKHFLLKDHVINGSHVLPGTAYIEMAKQISRVYFGDTSIEIKNVSFITPIILDSDSEREAHTVIERLDGFLKFSILSKQDGKNILDNQWIKHAAGEIHAFGNIIPKSYDLLELKKKCSEQEIDIDINKLARGFIAFGPHWQVFHKLLVGSNGALAVLELPEEFEDNLNEYYLHPTMLDMAAGAAGMTLGFKSLPFSYGKYRIFGPTPKKFYAYFKKYSEYDKSSETVSFDFDLVDTQGNVFAEIENFQLRKTRDFERVIKKSKSQDKEIFYNLSWRPEPLNSAEKKNKVESIIVFGAKNVRQREIVKDLAKKNKEIFQVDLGNEYKISKNKIVIRDQKEDYKKVAKLIKDKKINKIIHLMTLADDTEIKNVEALDKSQRKGVYSIFYLMQEIEKSVLTHTIEFILVSEFVEQVSGKEKYIRSENATMFGFGKSFYMEDPNIHCRAIDVDNKTKTKFIVEEICSPFSAYQIAYRDNQRYAQALDTLDLGLVKNRAGKIENGKTYLITGGTGGIGLEIAKDITSKRNVNLVLIGRTKLPPKNKWNEIIKNNNLIDAKVIKKIIGIKAIEKNCKQLLVFDADIAVYSDVKKIIDVIKKKFGRINGLFHVAGVAGDGFVVNKSEKQIKEVLAPKVRGTWILDHLTQDQKLDFFVMFSSTTAIHGSAGQSDYTAANSFLDSYARRDSKGRNFSVINWIGWNEVGMAVDNKVSSGQDDSFGTKEALVILNKILEKKLERVIVSSPAYIYKTIKESKRVFVDISENIKLDIYQYGTKQVNSAVAEEQEKQIKLKGKKSSEYSKVEKEIAQIWSKVLGYEEIDVNDNFFDLGGDSLMVTEVYTQLEKKYPNKINVAQLFAYPTISKLIEHISIDDKEKEFMDISGGEDNRQRSKDIAIIGMAGSTSLADNLSAFWNNLKTGIDSIRPVPEIRKRDMDNYMLFRGAKEKDLVYSETAYLEEIDKFDYEYFKLSPKEAELMDPNQRIFLETTCLAIEEAGYGGKKLRNTKTGLYLGLFPLGRSYYDLICEVEPESMAQAMVNNMEPTIASRISYFLNLTGPSMVVNTACSSSLVAVHLACQAIRNGECEQAIAGGIKIGLMFHVANPKVGIESRDGHTRSFDNDGDGTGLGEGVASLLLKPLDKAIQDGDNIHAVIKGSAVNQDGRSIGFTAPNARAQTELIVSAWKEARVNPETISYIEAHGTGTELGDPIEVEGLTNAFKTFTDRKQFCAIGSVKSNLGHLLESAGIFGLLKSVLALEHKQIPPSINFHEPNHKVSWDKSAVFVNNKLLDWKEAGEIPRRCGVSSFGLSGTNCHVILEEAPQISFSKVKNDKEKWKIFTLSAKNEKSFQLLVEKYLNYLDSDINIDNLCYTANTGREHDIYRLAVTIKTTEELKNKLRDFVKNNFEPDGLENVNYNNFKIVSLNQKEKKIDEVTEKEMREKGYEARVAIQVFENGLEKEREVALKICKLYVQGADIDWEILYQEKKYQKISLPTYIFQKKRCWIKVPEKVTSAKNYYSTTWREKKLEIKEESAPSLTVIFKNNSKKTGDIIRELKKKRKEIIEVTIGSEYKRIGPNKFVIKNEKQDYDTLMAEIEPREVRQIVHLLTLENNNEIENIKELKLAQEKGVFSLLYLAQAVQKNILSRTVDLVLVSDYVDQITGDEKIIKPENATMFGFGKAVVMENPGLDCRVIDIDDHSSSELIVKEINCAKSVFKVAYRNGKRYIEEVGEFDIKSAEDKPVQIRKDGVYLITGGTGGIALEIAQYISSLTKVKFALLSKSGLPDREEWEEILNPDGPKNKRLIKKIKAVQKIEENGSEVLFVEADIANESQMQTAFKKIKNKFREVNGIFHTAGIAGDGFILDKSAVALEKVLAPKVQGTWTLDHLTRNEELDFFALFSSAITIVGGLSVSDYLSANSYLDSYAYCSKNRRIISINWPTWQETGLSLQEKIDEKKQLFKIISPKKAIASLFEILSKDIQRVVPGELNYESDLLYLTEYLPFTLPEKITATVEKKMEKVKKQTKEIKLKGREDGKYTKTEKELAEIWSEVLGYEEIDINANFFDLGGDSLSGIRLLTRVNSEFDKEVSFRDVLQYPDLRNLAIIVERSEKKKHISVIKKVEPRQYKLK